MIESSRVVLGVAALAIGLAVPEGRAQSPQALLEHYKCNSCHAEREVGTGPAFVDVASKYRGDPEAAAALTVAVKQGAHGAGPWHMPPHPEVSGEEARAMARYIMSLSAEKPKPQEVKRGPMN